MTGIAVFSNGFGVAWHATRLAYASAAPCSELVTVFPLLRENRQRECRTSGKGFSWLRLKCFDQSSRHNERGRDAKTQI